MQKDFHNNTIQQTVTPTSKDRTTAKKILQKAVIFAAKWAVIILSGGYLYFRVLKDARFTDIFTLSLSILHSTAASWMLSICLILVLVNWGFEALKWQYLLKRFATISFARSFAAILSGNAVSLWMPNRVGEYIGRVFFLDPSVRIKSIFATLVGSVSQLVVTLFLGTFGFVFYTRAMHGPAYIEWAAGIAGLIFMALLLFFYFNIGVVRSWLPAKKWAKPFRKYLKVYKLYQRKDLETILLYSFGRYLVFSVQFYVFLVFFNIHIPFLEAMPLIFLMYLVQTISPTTNGFGELIVRGLTTASLFAAYTHNLTAVLAASYSLWLINLLVPALFGAVIFAFARISKRRRAV